MINPVSIDGINIYPFDSPEQLMLHIDKNKGILIAINAEKILHATQQTRDLINRNVGYCDGVGAKFALKHKGYP